MSNIEKAAQVLSALTTCDGEPSPSELHQRQAKALHDAGLLAPDECLCEGADGVTTPKCPACTAPVTRTEWGSQASPRESILVFPSEARARLYNADHVFTREVSEWVEAP